MCAYRVCTEAIDRLLVTWAAHVEVTGKKKVLVEMLRKELTERARQNTRKRLDEPEHVVPEEQSESKPSQSSAASSSGRAALSKDRPKDEDVSEEKKRTAVQVRRLQDESICKEILAEQDWLEYMRLTQGYRTNAEQLLREAQAFNETFQWDHARRMPVQVTNLRLTTVECYWTSRIWRQWDGFPGI